jgi:excisionase family DNA binding protein
VHSIEIEKQPPGLLYEQEAAHFLSLSVRTLQAWRVRGGGPRFCKIGRAVRYRRSDLATWVDAQIRTSTSDAGERA